VKNYHHGNLRAELLDTALQQLHEVGVDTLSLRALARAVGVSQTAPYRHFADKNELLAALATRGYKDLLLALRAAGDTTGDCPRQRLIAFAHAYVDYAATHPDLFKLMFGPVLQPTEKYPELRDAIRETFGLVQEILRHGIERGIFRQQDIAYLPMRHGRAYTVWPRLKSIPHSYLSGASICAARSIPEYSLLSPASVKPTTNSGQSATASKESKPYGSWCPILMFSNMP
jgi:AcrR family transcriptional regulator